MIITKKSVYRHLIIPLKQKGYNIQLVGSIAKRGFSNKDIDLLLKLPEYPKSEKIFLKFENDLKLLKWDLAFSDYNDEYGIFHNYRKTYKIGLDIFIEEK